MLRARAEKRETRDKSCCCYYGLSRHTAKELPGVDKIYLCSWLKMVVIIPEMLYK